MNKKSCGLYEKFFKRLMDLICVLAAALIFSWLYIIVAILVRAKLGSPIIFVQERPGKNGKIFKLYKFRTMTDEKDETGKLLPDEVRLTKFGKMLRATSLDELPELLNILRGEMSIVGPRPLLPQYLDRYTEFQSRRHDVRPGITGLAQVSGRNSISWENKFELDVRYVEQVSFWMDVKIILCTIGTVIRREGITSSTSETMEEFIGMYSVKQSQG